MIKFLLSMDILKLFIFIVSLSGKCTSNNVETYTYDVTVIETQCYPETIETGGKVGFSFAGIGINAEASYKKSSYNCIDAKVNRQKVGFKCKRGWTDLDSECTIAVCIPKCDGGTFCVQPDQCECNGRGSTCESVPCSSELNCYPGSCNQTGNTCNCPPGFTGPNCLTLTLKPTIKNCMAQIFVGSPERAVFTRPIPCTYDGQTAEPIWTNVSQPTRIQIQWRPDYENFVDLPPAQSAPHVGNAPVVLGITKASFKTSFSTREFLCQIRDGQNGNPPPNQDCDVPGLWSEISSRPLEYNQSMWINISAEIGGHKTGSAKTNFQGSFFGDQYFTGRPQVSQMLLQLDDHPPVHCLTGKSTQDQAVQCDTFPIHLKYDVTTNSRFVVYFYNWTDDASHIENYHLDVYYMRAGGDKILRNVGNAISSQDIGVESKTFTFDLRDSGVYALELTVRDKAGNEARARKIVLYNSQSTMNVNSAKPLRILQSNITASGQWITDINALRNGQGSLTVDWTGRFTSTAQFQDEWTYPVNPWNDKGIDDRFGPIYGRRSIDSMDSSLNGVVVYSLAYTIDDQGGRGLDYSNETWKSFNSTVVTYKMTLNNVNDGDSVVIWFNANDALGSGNDNIETLIIHVDTSRPEVFDSSFKFQSPDQYTLSLLLNATDRDSGIREIRYSIKSRLAATSAVEIHSDTAAPVTREYPERSGKRKKRSGSTDQSPCAPGDTTCYCIRAEKQCYSVIQTILIDNCKIAKYSGQNLEISYTVVNLAGLESPERTIELGKVADIPCNPNSGGTEAPVGLIVGLVLGLILGAAFIFIAVMVIRVKVLHKPKPEFVNKLSSVNFRRGGHKSEANTLYASAAEIQGIERKPDNDKFGLSDEPPPYYDTKSKGSGSRSKADSDGDVVGRVDRKDVRYGEQMGKGRFATVYKAGISRSGRKSVVVAAKKLRTGYEPDDVELMKSKIQFLKNVVPQHVNIVRYVGETDESNVGPPVLLLEFCELNLLDWLKGLNEINSTVETHLINIALNIARGMEHLHKNKIVHRRLAARNVLLNHGGGGGNQEIVAKIIGFGPASEKREKSSPIEWFAPETIESLNSVPVYNKRTDSWAFAIVMYEIFSRGTVPYPDVSRDNLLSHLKSGGRMDTPKHMPNKLYEDVVQQCWQGSPMKRPEFSAICEIITSYRDAEEQPMYLAA